MKRTSIVLILAVAALWSRPVVAQTSVDAPRSHALTNARIVVSPGQVIERGTVVVRDGRIAAVGANVQVPAGVIALDVAGRTVYAGLIDAANSVGLPSAPQGGGRGGGGGGAAGGPSAETSGPPYEVDSGRAAADVFDPGDNAIANLRAAGITTVGLTFQGGIFPGRVSAIDTKDGSASSLVIRSPVAQQIALGRKRGAYPSTLMGALVYVKQSFADARYDARVAAAFQRSPSTTPLPTYDAEHVGLQPAAAGTMPVWLAASSAYDIHRVIELAGDIRVSDYTILGAQEAWKVAGEIKASGKSVIVSLAFPNPNQVSGRSFEEHVAPVSGEDSEDEKADSAVAKQLRGNAAALVAAGVPFALSGLGTSGPSQFRDRIVVLVEEGLPAEEALRALTVTPARLLGLEGALGTVEVGKWANLVVSEGDLFTKDAKIRHVFVEGERYDIPAAPARSEQGGGRGGRAGGPGGAAAASAAAAGEWSGSIDAQGQSMGFSLSISGSGDQLTGSLGTEMGTTALRGEQNGADVTLSGTADMNGQAFPISVNVRIDGNTMTGTITAGDMGSFPLTARRGGGADRVNDRQDGGNR